MRPTTRPSRPYTRAEIMERVYVHFITEGNPRCYVTNSMGESCCEYTGCGCGIGCMLTMEDAEAMPRARIETAAIKKRELVAVYFSGEDLRILSEIQMAHDGIGLGEHPVFRENILKVLTSYGFQVPA